MSVVELKEHHMEASDTANSLRERLKQKHASLLNTDVAGYARSQRKTPLTFGPHRSRMLQNLARSYREAHY
ncbi:hypothetical protein ACFX2C_004494 [Malus domestica]